MKDKLKEQLRTEVDAAFLYRTLSNNIADTSLSSIYGSMSEIEATHARKILNSIRENEKDEVLPQPTGWSPT